MSATDIALAQLESELGKFEKTLIRLIQKKREKSMMAKQPLEIAEAHGKLKQTPIAIIGMASIFPQARNLKAYWTNILHKVDCITEVPPSRWKVEDYYDPDPKAPDKTYCKKGGFIPDIDFNPLEFGLPPNLLEVTDVSQLLGLVVAKEAMEDAGYGESRKFNRERTGVILGVALAKQLTIPLFSRLQYPIWERVLKSVGLSDADTQTVVEKLKLAYVQWQESAFPGMLANVVAGRIANRLNLGGMNCVVDAACASSLGALKIAISELSEHRSDLMLTGGVDTDNSSMAYLCFSKTPALSRKQTIRPFDIDSDGMMLGEGIGMMALKRLEDAERDGDRIYAVIREIGTSSDGRYKSIYAPRQSGQVQALRRAYQRADIAPETIGLIEAHGTGTAAGDPTEFFALKEVFGVDNPKRQHIAIGSVKSQIGHTKAAAGAASLIKASLALHHKVLPPTINITKPNPKLEIETSAFYLNTEARPWIRPQKEGAPRRAGVSSFGFGGTNYHVILEEYVSEQEQAYRLHNTPQPVLLFADTPEQLIARCEARLEQLKAADGEPLYREWVNACQRLEIPMTSARVGFVADSPASACKALQTSIEQLQRNLQADAWEHPRGIFYRKAGIDLSGKVVALFSGQGSQYLNMGRELAINFPGLRQLYSEMDTLMAQDDLSPVSQVVYPPPSFEPDQEQTQDAQLRRTEYAQPAIGILSVGLYKIFQQAGFNPDFVAGHSFGELTALWASGVLSDEDYLFLVKARGQAMAPPDDPDFEAGAMLAVKEELSRVETVAKQFPEIMIANHNSNYQVVLAGPKRAIVKVQHALESQGYSTVLLPVAAAFHTPLVGHALAAFASASESVTFRQATIPIYTNVTAQPYPTDPKSIRELLETHLSKPVLFKQQIENLYEAGGFCFVEFGPRAILTNLVKDILGDRPHLAVALNASRQKGSDLQLREAAVKLQVSGLPLTTLDPYPLQPQTPEILSKKGLNIRINAANYVSEKTSAAFERALQDGGQVSLSSRSVTAVANGAVDNGAVDNGAADNGAINSGKGASLDDLSKRDERQVESTVSSALTFPSEDKSATALHAAANGNSKNNHGDKPSAKTTQSRQRIPNNQDMPYSQTAFVSAKPTPKFKMQPKPDSAQLNPINSQPDLDRLERGAARLHQHQCETLRVHGQYLHHQAEYTRAFFQLMQQQHSVLSNGNPSASEVEKKLAFMNSLERSLAQFHQHQVETSRLHAQYLTHQVEYTQNYCTLVFQRQDFLIQNGHTPSGIGWTQGVSSAPNDKGGPLTSGVFSQSVETVDEHISANGDALDSLPKPATSLVNHPTSPSSNGVTPVSITPTTTTIIHPGVVEATPKITSDATTALSVTLDAVAPKAVSANVEDVSAEHFEIQTPSSLAIDPGAIAQSLIGVVSDKTGYPADMLELDMDMEADLGIDSIKRVEILGALQELYSEFPEAPPEDLAELRTLGQIVNYLQQQAASGVADAQLSAPPDSNEDFSVQPSTTVNAVHAPVPPERDQSPVSDKIALRAASEIEGNGASSQITRDPATIAQSLIAVVSDKTGYPADMLELEMDMEADLGIDSIKRVEILGALQEMYPEFPEAPPEDLAELRTLGQIVNYLQQQMEKKNLSSNSSNQPLERVKIGDQEGTSMGAGEDTQPHSVAYPSISRNRVTLKPLSEPDFLDFVLPDQHLGIVTDDGSPVTTQLAQTLRQRGWRVIVLSFPPSLISVQSILPRGVERVALADLTEASIQRQLAEIATHYGPIAAFIYLHPIAQAQSAQTDRSLATEKALLKQVFLIAKHLKKPLNQAAQSGRSCFLTIARLDGQLGLGDTPDFGVIGGGLFGLTKALNLEWESVFCRAIDLSPTLDREQSVQSILAELHDPNRLIVEVGCSSQGRTTLVREARVPIPKPNGTGSKIKPTSVFLVSGGARGITAQCVIQLAQRYHCRFILLGRSAIAESEPSWALGCPDEISLKQSLIDNCRTRGEKLTPVMVQRRLKVILHRREILETLQAIEQAGGQADYLSVDVTKTSTLPSQLAASVERLGPITGMIHGAGNIADKRIENKTEQDFETVYAAKVEGLANLLRCIPADQLRYLVLFSSVVGFYGNVGQTDYAIANEILNKSAYLIKHAHPHCHVTAINWGPWESGMVTSALKQAFAEHNIETIPISLGTQLLLEQLDPVNQDVVQVVVGSPISPNAEAPYTVPGKFRIQRHLALADNPFLQDHVISNRPVLPATCALAWIANTGEQLYPGYHLFSCANFKILKGIIFDDNQTHDYVLDLQAIPTSNNNEINCEAKIWSQNRAGKIRYHFSAQLILSRQIPDRPIYESFKLEADPIIQISTADLYQSEQSVLFHGPAFQGIKSILNIDAKKIVTQSFVKAIPARKQGKFPSQAINPYIVDVQIHPMLVWLHHFYREACLPTEIQTFEQFAFIPYDQDFYVSTNIRSRTNSTLVADVVVHDQQGRIYCRMVGAKGTILSSHKLKIDKFKVDKSEKILTEIPV